MEMRITSRSECQLISHLLFKRSEHGGMSVGSSLRLSQLFTFLGHIPKLDADVDRSGSITEESDQHEQDDKHAVCG